MRKIISGQSFLYRKNGYHSTIIEVIMKDRVRGDYLQMALSLSLQRFPYLSDKLVEKKGSYYLCEDLNSMTINSTKKLRTLGKLIAKNIICCKFYVCCVIIISTNYNK